jgi:Leucine-rich repeat (LRR) protein
MLSVSCSGLTEIPPEVWKLTNLRSLYVSKNTVITIPPEVGRLIHLEILHVSSIPIDKFETSQPLKSCVIT